MDADGRGSKKHANKYRAKQRAYNKHSEKPKGDSPTFKKAARKLKERKESMERKLSKKGGGGSSGGDKNDALRAEKHGKKLKSSKYTSLEAAHSAFDRDVELEEVSGSVDSADGSIQHIIHLKNITLPIKATEKIARNSLSSSEEDLLVGQFTNLDHSNDDDDTSNFLDADPASTATDALGGNFHPIALGVKEQLDQMPGRFFVNGTRGINEHTVQIAVYEQLRTAIRNNPNLSRSLENGKLVLVYEAEVPSTTASANNEQAGGFIDVLFIDHANKSALAVECKYERMGAMRYTNGKNTVDGSTSLKTCTVNANTDADTLFQHYRLLDKAVPAMRTAKRSAVDVDKCTHFDSTSKERYVPVRTLVDGAKSPNQLGKYLDGLMYTGSSKDRIKASKGIYVCKDYTLHTIVLLQYGPLLYYELDTFKIDDTPPKKASTSSKSTNAKTLYAVNTTGTESHYV